MKHLILVSAILLSAGASAQKKGQALVDSLLVELTRTKHDTAKVWLYDNIARAYMLFDPKEEFRYMEQGLQLAEKIHWKRGIANLNNDLGLMIGDTGNNTGSRVHFEKSYIINKEIGSKINQVNDLNNIGRSYQRESNFSRAIEYFFKGLALAEEIKNPQKIALVCTNITSSFFAQGNYVKATEYAEMALKNGELAKAPNDIGKALLMLGAVKQKINDTPAARSYMTRSLKTYEEMGNKIQTASVLANLAELEYPDYKKVIDKMLEAQKIYDETGRLYVGSITNIANLGDAYYQFAIHSRSPEKERYLKLAETYLLEGVALCKQVSNTEILATIDHSLASLEETKGNYKASLGYYKTATSINDSLFSQEKKNEIAGLEGRHNLELKDNEIAINKLTLSNQQKTQAGLIAGLLLICIIAGLLYRQNRNRKRTNTTLMVLNNQLDEANKIKAKFFGILSHDLRSPIANLIHFLHLQKDEPGLLSEGERIKHQQKITQSAEDLLTNMESMLLWSKGQMENFKPNIRIVPVSDLFDYIQKFFGETEHTRIRFIQTPTPDLEVSTDENYLQIIMQNLTSNAIKALKNKPDGLIEWNAKKEGDKTILSITDNGPGISQEQVKALYEDSVGVNEKSGFGLHLVKDLARAIQYKISVESHPGKGTTFILST